MQPLVVLTRSNFIESIHYGYICVVDSNKKIISSIGNIDTKVYLRSTAKPFQALPVVHSGAFEKFKLSLKELAVICASHSGQDFHREAVRSILNKIGLKEDNLSCGAANPYNKDTLNKIIKKGERPSELYNNCSGLHAGMLVLCRYYGFPVNDYYKPDHPVQKLILKVITDLLECSENDIFYGLDGCGIPTFITTLNQAAYIYSKLAQGANGNSIYSKSLGIMQEAMSSYPYMISGNNEFCSELISITNGKAIGKIGAEGIYCVAVPEKQLGICVKISDGRERAIYPAVTHVLSQLGVLNNDTMQKLKTWAYTPIKNHKGELTGYTIPIFNINKPGNISNINIGDRFETNDKSLL